MDPAPNSREVKIRLMNGDIVMGTGVVNSDFGGYPEVAILQGEGPEVFVHDDESEEPGLYRMVPHQIIRAFTPG